MKILKSIARKMSVFTKVEIVVLVVIGTAVDTLIDVFLP